MAEGRLAGFRILDLTQVVSGPFCTMLLGDLGADVIKVEPPEGDSTRRFGRPLKNGVTATFLAFNRNKRSLVVDLKKDHGRDIVRKIALKSDAMIEDNRPGAAGRVPMREAMMAFSADDSMIGYTFIPEDEFKDQVPKNQSLDPFKTKDGWVTIAPYTDDQWEHLCEGVGHPEWWQAEDRRERMRTVLRGLAKLFPEQERAHWLKLLEDADVPSGPVHSYETLFSDPEIVANENFHLYEHPQAGKVRTVNPGMRFSETPARVWRVPPRLGEHTEEVLRESGMPREQLEELRKEKVINY